VVLYFSHSPRGARRGGPQPLSRGDQIPVMTLDIRSTTLIATAPPPPPELLRLNPVMETFDYGNICYDTVLTAADIVTLMDADFVKNDPERQRGKNNISGLYMLKEERVNRWTRQL